jgi:hypothetical protein
VHVKEIFVKIEVIAEFALEEDDVLPRVPGAKGLQVQGSRFRPPGGTIGFGFTQDALVKILNTPTVQLDTRRAVRAQLLLRMYGSDGGEWAYRTALSFVTPVVNGLAETAPALEAQAIALKARGDIDYSAEMALGYPDGDNTNVAPRALGLEPQLFLGRGDGTFAAGQTFAVRPRSYRAGLFVDLDGDGDDDVVLVGDDVALLRNRGGCDHADQPPERHRGRKSPKLRLAQVLQPHWSRVQINCATVAILRELEHRVELKPLFSIGVPDNPSRPDATSGTGRLACLLQAGVLRGAPLNRVPQALSAAAACGVWRGHRQCA